jgi:hypothetical protein
MLEDRKWSHMQPPPTRLELLRSDIHTLKAVDHLTLCERAFVQLKDHNSTLCTRLQQHGPARHGHIASPWNAGGDAVLSH